MQPTQRRPFEPNRTKQSTERQTTVNGLPYPHTAPVTAVLPVLKISTQVNAPIAALSDVVGFPVLNDNTKLMDFEQLSASQSKP